MKTVWKYQIEFRDTFALMAPPTGRVVHFEMQHGVPCFWLEFIPGDHCVRREFKIFGTGHPTIPNHAVHCGTTFDGPYVWHLYEITAP